jgi:hypothetical protein
MSVVKISTFNLLCNHFILIKPNCAGIMYRRSFTKIIHFVLIMQTKWPEEIHVSDWSKKKSTQIILGQLEQKFAGMMYGMTSTKRPHFLQTAFPQRQSKVLICQIHKKNISETTFLNET